MNRQIRQLGLTLLLIFTLAAEAGAFLAPGIPAEDREEILIDIRMPDGKAMEIVHISLSIHPDGTGGSRIAVIQDGSPWWADRILVRKARQGIEIARSMARILWKITIRMVPVPAIY